MTTRVRRRGFTLPEVLATLVIVGIVLPVAMRGITVSLRAAGDARHKVEAGQLAQQKLNELVLDVAKTGASDGSGDFGDAWREYKWTSHTATAGLNVTAEVNQLDVTVTWVAQGVDRSVTLTTLVYPDAATAVTQ